jgi:DNA-binding transcriptional ArsR family regulator
MFNHMVESETLDARFAALADPTRRAIVRRLARGESTVGELAAPFDMTFAAVSKHVGVLEEAGLVARRREGRSQVCRLRRAGLDAPAAWLDRARHEWETRLDRMQRMAEEME